MDAATIVQRRQQFYVLTGTRKIHIFYKCKIEQELGCFYHFIGKHAFVVVGVIDSTVERSTALPPFKIKNMWRKFIVDV